MRLARAEDIARYFENRAGPAPAQEQRQRFLRRKQKPSISKKRADWYIAWAINYFELLACVAVLRNWAENTRSDSIARRYRWAAAKLMLVHRYERRRRSRNHRRQLKARFSCQVVQS